jgi:hypothetical protein
MREREREKKCNLNRIFACEHGRLLCYIREMRQHISCPALGRRKKKKKKNNKKLKEEEDKECLLMLYACWVMHWPSSTYTCIVGGGGYT